VEFKAWIPHESVADPFILKPFHVLNSFINSLGSPIHECFMTASSGIPSLNIPVRSSQFLGDRHVNYGLIDSEEKDYRILSWVEFDFNGDEIFNFTQNKLAGISTRALVVGSVKDGTLLCTQSAQADTSVIPPSILMDNHTFQMTVKGTDGLAPQNPNDLLPICARLGQFRQQCVQILRRIPATPSLDGELQGVITSEGDLQFSYTTDLFPSYGIGVTRNGHHYMSPVITDASCVEAKGVIGAANLLVGLVTVPGVPRLSGIANRNTPDKPCDAGLIPPYLVNATVRVLDAAITPATEPTLLLISSYLPNRE